MAAGGILAHRSGASLWAGIAGGLAAGMLPIFLLGAIVTLMLAWCPERPPCICGKCNSEKYHFVGPMHKTDDNVYYYKCPRCSQGYRLQGEKFELKGVHGYSPYMEKSRWKRWKRSIRQGP